MFKPLMLFEFVVTQMTMHHSFYIYASKRHQKLINILWTNLYLLIVKADNGYLKKDFIYVFVNTHTHIYTCAHMCRCLWRPEGGHQIPRSWSCRHLWFTWCGYWVLTLVFMVEQQVLLSCFSIPGQWVCTPSAGMRVLQMWKGRWFVSD